MEIREINSPVFSPFKASLELTKAESTELLSRPTQDEDHEVWLEVKKWFEDRGIYPGNPEDLQIPAVLSRSLKLNKEPFVLKSIAEKLKDRKKTWASGAENEKH